LVDKILIVNAAQEPIPGWTDNLNGTVGILIACNTGLFRNLNADEDICLDNITVDIVIKAIILAVWKRSLSSVNKQIEVIHISAYQFRPLKIKDLGIIGMRETDEVPFEKAVWVPVFLCSASWAYFYLNFVLFQVLPSALLDVLVKLAGHKKFLVRVQRKAYTVNLVLGHFMNNNWTFKNDKFFALFDHLTDEEQRHFSFRYPQTTEELSAYVRNSLDYARVTIMKESKDIKPRTRRIRKIMRFLDTFFKMAFYCLCLWLIFVKCDMISSIGSFLYNNDCIRLLREYL
ncbi:hypothetical protein GWI33_011224, partial [Rhynchophorus ferrugineus]